MATGEGPLRFSVSDKNDLREFRAHRFAFALKSGEVLGTGFLEQSFVVIAHVNTMPSSACNFLVKPEATKA